MNVLLDTCALLALAGGELPEAAAAALRKAPEAYVSAVSGWEKVKPLSVTKMMEAVSPVCMLLMK